MQDKEKTAKKKKRTQELQDHVAMGVEAVGGGGGGMFLPGGKKRGVVTQAVWSTLANSGHQSPRQKSGGENSSCHILGGRSAQDILIQGRKAPWLSEKADRKTARGTNHELGGGWGKEGDEEKRGDHQ